MIFTKSNTQNKFMSHEAPRTLLLITHAQVFTFTEGWNELRDEPKQFAFAEHAFNFDYLLHLSGINYLIHPEDVSQIIQMVKHGATELVEFNFRFINRSGEIKKLVGLARLEPRV